ncbi:hypothetical protein J4429_03670 [Candidatus Pacearchaeota archaeon]|nr:hypothetical protein [Candidatus Pacearchaeota archaeon]
MKIESKDILITIIGLILTALLSISINLEKIGLKQFLSNNFILIIAISVSIIIVVYMKINEINQELDNQKIEQNRLSEKLKIHEHLINIKAEIKTLQKEVFKK